MASAAMAAVAAALDKFYPGAGRCDVFFVEDIDRGQADVSDFLLTTSDLVAVSGAGVGTCAAGQPGTADALLASDNDNPAAPNTGRASGRTNNSRALGTVTRQGREPTIDTPLQRAAFDQPPLGMDQDGMTKDELLLLLTRLHQLMASSEPEN